MHAMTDQNNADRYGPCASPSYLDRELAHIAFFRRVLEEAQDPVNPLLERVAFLAIVGSDLAEFFMVRVAGIRQQIEAGIVEPSPSGLSPAQQLQALRPAAQDLMNDARACLQGILPPLEAAGIRILDFDALERDGREAATRYYHELVFPVLTPLAVDPGRPFPHISNRSLNLAVVIRDGSGQERFARVKLPATLSRLLPVDGGPDGGRGEDARLRHDFVWLDHVVAANLPSLFPGMRILRSYPFRVTRDAEVPIQELEAEDLLETIERGVRRRRFGRVVRVTVDRAMPPDVRAILAENLEIDPADMYALTPPLGMSDLIQLHGLDRPDLKYPRLLPAVPPDLEGTDGDLFAAIRRRDILLHHPFDSFSPVVEFLAGAARDPAVLAIKQTLYRVGRDSPIVQALLEAAGSGKQVAVLVELKARFDEESNIEWARALEREGVHVVYGLPGLKIHAKMALVVRREGDAVRRYVHLSSGNYNPATARGYTDLGLFTCDEPTGADVSDFFNYLTGYSRKCEYRKLLVAPVGLRAGLVSLIRREIGHQAGGRQGHLIFKCNALVDPAVITLLYDASRAGVRIDLLVRGICCLRPGIPGVSETIRVRSLVGRFLEHSRAFYFRNGGDEEIYLGSADLMARNLDWRVEVLFPVREPRLVRTLRDGILEAYLADTAKSRDMLPDGSYHRAGHAEGKEPFDAQSHFIRARMKKE